MELIQTIALLCSVSTGNINIVYLTAEQSNCHKYYIKCVTETYVREAKDTALIKCVKERKI